MHSILKLSKQTFFVVLFTTAAFFLGLSFQSTNYNTRYPHQCTCNEPDLVKIQRTIGESDGKEIKNKRTVVKEKDDITFDNTTTNDGEDDNEQQLNKTGYTRPRERRDNTSESLVHLMDYVKYPCLSGSNQSERLRLLDRCIRTVNVQLIADTVKSVECVKLNVDISIPICIHDPRTDIYVSGSIFATGAWEKELLKIFLKALNNVKDIVVLDIGCNIGSYTLVAAKDGKRVVSIDANVENLRLLSKSLILGNFTENVTLIWNALSDTYTNVSLVTNQFNVGAFSVNTDNISISGNDVVIINTILLDDLMYLVEGKPVGIKMDVERFELHVLKGGMTFMKNMDVRFIQIEIGHHLKLRSGQSIVITLSFFGFKPFENCLGNKELVDLPLKDWPFDVCFIKDLFMTDDADKKSPLSRTTKIYSSPTKTNLHTTN